MLRIKCPKCQKVLQLDSAPAGSIVACPACSAKLRVPAAKAPANAKERAESIKPADPRGPRVARDEISLEAVERARPASPRKPPPLPADRLEVTEAEEDSRPAPRAARERFEPVPYEAEGGVSPWGVPVLFVFLSLGGLLFGWLAAFIGQWFYLVLLFPFAIGFGIFGAGYVGVRLGKVRNPVVGALAGLFGGLVAMLTFHYAIYLRAINATPVLGQNDRMALSFSPRGFVDFMDARAQDGVRLSSTRSLPKDSGMNLGYAGSYIYWFVEFLVVAAIGLGGMLLAASQPFCRRCKNWKQKQVLGTLQLPHEPVVQALQDGDIALLTDFSPEPKGGPLLLTAAVCPNCTKKGEIDVKLEHVIQVKKNEQKKKELVHLTYPRAALAPFREVFGWKAVG